MNSLKSVCDYVGGLLAPFGPTHFGANEVARSASPRRWVWSPISETFDAPDMVDGSLCTRVATVAIYNWGRDEAEAEAMQAAVISGLRDAFNGARIKPTSSAWTPREEAHRGASLVTTVTLRIPMERVAMPLTDNTIGGVTFESVVVEDTQTTGEIED